MVPYSVTVKESSHYTKIILIVELWQYIVVLMNFYILRVLQLLTLRLFFKFTKFGLDENDLICQ